MSTTRTTQNDALGEAQNDAQNNVRDLRTKPDTRSDQAGGAPVSRRLAGDPRTTSAALLPAPRTEPELADSSAAARSTHAEALRDPKPDPEPDPKTGPKTDPKPDPKTDPKPDRTPDPSPDSTPDPTTDHRLRWPEALAITLALLLGGAVAAGTFRPMLPWLG